MVGATLADVVRILVQRSLEQLVHAVLAIVVPLSRQHVFRNHQVPTLHSVLLVHLQLLLGRQLFNFSLCIRSRVQFLRHHVAELGTAEGHGLRESHTPALRAHPLLPRIFEGHLLLSELSSAGQTHVVIGSPFANHELGSPVLLPLPGHVDVVLVHHHTEPSEDGCATFLDGSLLDVHRRVGKDWLPVHGKTTAAATMVTRSLALLHPQRSPRLFRGLSSKLRTSCKWRGARSRPEATGQKIEGRDDKGDHANGKQDTGTSRPHI
mmetsp:Transcript_106993/g.149136  ORF Transcript_106993/g.149136 Transcript_106993/m.149136 type:complete len:265 (-) Transcript_106993:42-836(-)